ncbi:MAG TPA: hypothetical protein VMD30_09830, partial [Tepidisphaeraceae bacterium]|nr:hypothetical protein [Tepidisphaeraceae bacterium]
AFDDLLDRLESHGIAPTACLTALPPDIAAQMNASTWTDLLKVDPSTWQPALSYFISRYCTRLDRWQLGGDGIDDFARDEKMRQVYRLVYKQFAELMGSPDLAMPWPAWYDLGSDPPATVALWLPSDVLPRQIPLYTQQITDAPSTPDKTAAAPNLALTLQLLDEKYGRMLRINDLAERMVYALSAGAQRIDLPLPLKLTQDGQRLSLQPQELLIIERTLINVLGGAQYKGRVPIADGVEAFLFEKNDRGIIVLWSRSADTNDRALSINLGPQPMILDLWGNLTPLLPSRNDAVTLTVGPTPFFILDVDPIPAQLRASVAFDNPLLESSFTPHPRHLHFVNSSDTMITGSLRLVGPKGWVLTPCSFQFQLDPGQTFDQQVVIEFPYNSFAGAKTIDAEFALDGTLNTNFRVPLAMSLGLSDVGVQSLAMRDGQDLLVQQLIANYGDKPIDYYAYAVYPGQARQERLVIDLKPGHSTIKLYRFKDVQFFAGAKVRDGVRQMEGLRVLNEQIPID